MTRRNVAETGSLRDVVPLHVAQETLRQERSGMTDVMVQKPELFKVVVNESKDEKKAGYSLDLKGRVVPFTTDGMASLCKMLGMDYKYFKDYPRKQEFIEHVQTLLPKVTRETGGVLVRQAKDGSVRGVVPGNYTVLDDEQVLGLVGAIAAQTLRQLKGVQVTSTNWNGSLDRLVFGDSPFERDEIYPTVTLRNNEVGGSLSLQFGTLRIRCLNGSIDTTKVGQVLNWGHRGQFDKQVLKVGDALRQAGDRIVPMMGALRASQSKELAHPGEELHKLLRAGWVSQTFHDQAEGVLSAQLTKGETFGSVSPRSKYAVFNALTETTKLYKPKDRARWEAVAHNYLLLN